MHPLKVTIAIFGLLCFVSSASSQSRTGEPRTGKANSIQNKLACQHLPADFRVEFNACNQYQVDFINTSPNTNVVSWNFGDGASWGAIDRISHVYNAEGVYNARLVVLNYQGCLDTIVKKFLLQIDKGHLFANKNLSVCKGAPFRMPGDAGATDNCWSSATYLDSFDIWSPLCTPFNNIGYQYNILNRETSILANENFSGGNGGFSTDYIYDSFVNTKGHYFIGPKPRQWNPLYDNCILDTANLGDTMMIVNGAATGGVTVWQKTVPVLPNTNYLFGFYAQPLTTNDSLVLQVSINAGQLIGHLRLSNTPCDRQRFGTSWYSDASTSVTIRITDLDTDAVNNNFALDSLFFRPVYLKTDSIFVSMVLPPIVSVQPAAVAICSGSSVAFTASGGDVYSWSPAAAVSQPFSASTIATPTSNTTYKVVVTESTCSLKDSAFATVLVKPLPPVTVSKSNDLNCQVVQSTLIASGGMQYHWWPESTLSNPFIATPLATPHDPTVYHVEVTGENACITEDSIQVNVMRDEGENSFLVPTAFTPNDDGLNDCFGVRKWGLAKDLKLSIYNRWGHLVFYSNDPSGCWNGMYKNKAQPSGTYVYYIRGNTICGDVERRGTVVLLR